MTTSGERNEFVTLVACLEGDEPVRRRVRKDVIQSESSFLKEYIEDVTTEIKIPLSRPKNLDSILNYVHEGQLTASEESHLESLWNDARILGLVNLEKVCIQRLTDTISFDSWTQRLEFARAEGCPELESKVLSFVNDNFEDCCRCSTFIPLPVDQMVQVLQLPTVQTAVTESKRIALIRDWIKVNEVDRRPQAHRLLVQVSLMRLTQDTLRSFFDEESAFRNWRCVAIFESAIRLKKLEDTARHSGTVRARLDECEPREADSVMLETLEATRTIKQEEACDAEHLEVNQSYGDNDGDPSAPKIPKMEYSQADPLGLYQPRASNQKQILFLRQSNQHVYDLNFVNLNGDSVSQARRVQVDLPYYNYLGPPKLIWSEQARGLFFLGGVNSGGRVLSAVRYMNGQQPLQVTDGPKMFRRRHRFHPVTLNGSLCVFGGSRCLGFKNKTRRCEAEVMHMTADSSGYKWLPMNSTPIRCDLFTAAVAGGRIYMIGGVCDYNEKVKYSQPVISDEVICYETTTNKWKLVSRMSSPRCGQASAVVGRRIYVVGGSNSNYTDPKEDLANLRTAEVYDIEENQWTVIAPMGRPRFGASAVEMDGKIYVFGGDYNSEGKCEPSVECYDPVSDSWTYISTSLDTKGFFDSIAVIENPEYFL